MYIVEITGWEPGFNKVACTSTLCSFARVSLSEGKRITDAVLNGESQRIVLSTEEDVLRLIEFLRGYGAIAHAV
jgi:hypothetical protein